MEASNRWISFKSGGFTLGIPVDDVKEIAQVGKITPVPKSPEFVLGLTNARGRIVVLLDFLKRTGERSAPIDNAKEMIVLSDAEALYGIPVERILGILELSSKDIEKPSKILSGNLKPEYLKGITGVPEKHPVILLNIAEILKFEESAYV